jgi:hypothetical protein
VLFRSQANYEDPRLFQDSSLIHSLFIASSETSSAREKAIEALILECLIERKSQPISLLDLNNWLQNKNCPQIDQLLINGILQKSKYLSKDNQNNIVFESDNTVSILNSIKIDFEKQRNETIDEISLSLSDGLGLDTSIVKKELNLADLVEKYLCAVFLEIRFMANYFKSTQLLFEKLSSEEDFDYIIKMHLSNCNSIGIEQFALLKKLFLDALSKVATKDNKYIATIFHNILMIYYLNRSEKYIHSQLEIIKQKEIYLDTNVLYSIKCNYSQYHDMLIYIIENLIRLGAKIFVFDKSVNEYNDSLTTTLRKYKNDTLNFLHQEKKPWIWFEYENNRHSYQNSFEYCISLHHIPVNTNNSIEDHYDEAKKDLLNSKIQLTKLEPYLDENSLTDIYSLVYNAKKVYNSEFDLFGVPYDSEFYKMKVLHDSNCLFKLKSKASNPFEAKQLFVTCDYHLTKVRKYEKNEYEYLVAITEFYEFILPYLFLSDTITANPIETPNFLLASAISIDLSNVVDLDSMIGKYLIHGKDINQKYEIISKIKESERYNSIKKKHETLFKQKQ